MTRAIPSGFILSVLLLILSMAVPAASYPEWKVSAGSENPDPVLLPRPRNLTMAKDSISGPAVRKLNAALKTCLEAKDPMAAVCERGVGLILLKINHEGKPQPQGYKLKISGEGVRITAPDPAGLWNGLMTLRQLARQAGFGDQLPCLEISDWPDFPARGIMLDVARCKVPTMETLYRFVDTMAEWKMNELQLYIEHTFAYKGHEVAWQDASPITPEEARKLDAYCKARGIELVPNQNSFGHMGRWLKHDAYAPLAEDEKRTDLCPVDPASVAFLKDLYGQLLPCFSSGMVNVGCDETYSLGKGRSKAEADRIGAGRVYLNFLKQISDLAASHGKRMQFWGDIIQHYPELIPELPQGAIAVEWGYEANHPFATRCAKYAAAKVPFYMAPGSSSWNSLIGRNENALANLRLAAENGMKFGAMGFLMTDWGDGGHWQFLPISYYPFAYGAGVAWAREGNQDADVARALDMHLFQDRAGVMGKLLFDLGLAYKETGVLISNRSIFYPLLEAQPSERYEKQVKACDPAKLRKTREVLEEIRGRLPKADMDCADARQILKEIDLGCRMAQFACDLGVARVAAACARPAELPAETRKALAKTWRPVIPEFKKLWMARNRKGGLAESVQPFEALLQALEVGK